MNDAMAEISTPEKRDEAVLKLRWVADFLDDGSHEKLVDELRSIAGDIETLDAPVERGG